MSAARDLPTLVTTAAHRSFNEVLDRIDAVIAYHFRRWPRGRREEAMAEARAGCWVAWHGLLLRDKDPIAVGICGIAANACRAVRNGRTVGRNRAAGRTGLDIQHPKVRHSTGLRVVSLEERAERSPVAWREWLASERGYGPGEEAAFRIDFAAWLDDLPERKRRVGELLAGGLRACDVAIELGVTAGAISQTREWLARSWGQFQGVGDEGR
jgi:hypothetical protein